MTENNLNAFTNCPALDGYHCQTNSLAKIFHFNEHPLSEEMLLGLGAGMGYFYWHQKGTHPFVGGRGNVKNFFTDLGRRTGVKIEVRSTSSEKKAVSSLIEQLERKVPVMLYGDMGFLPWFDMPEGYHFGGHTFVACGYDGNETVLASDMEARDTGLKKGLYYPVTIEQLQKARSSKYKPFPPKNTWLEFDFSQYRLPGPDEIYDSISQTVKEMTEPPISNAGIKGIRRTGKEMKKWPGIFDDSMLRLVLFQVYIFIEVGGTGGGCFRYLFSRFLKEAGAVTSDPVLDKASELIGESGKQFTALGELFRDYEHMDDIKGRIDKAGYMLNQIADIEESAYELLSTKR